MLTRRIKMESGEPVYHCIGRIVGGDMVMGDEEKEYFRRLLWRLAEFSGVEVITYCVMSNHVHLLIRVPVVADLSDAEIGRRLMKYYGKKEPWVQVVLEGIKRQGCISTDVRERLLARMGDVSMFMRTLKQRYSKWHNRKHKRFGTLWAERFKSVLVEDASEALRMVAMYIDLNPVRAGLVSDPKDYRFCGHAEAIAGNRTVRQNIQGLCARKTWRGAMAEYRQFMMVYAGDTGSAEKRALSQDRIREVLQRGGRLETGEVLRLRLRYFTDGLVFGSREFVERVFEQFQDRFGERRTTGARRMHALGANLGEFAAARDLRKAAVG